MKTAKTKQNKITTEKKRTTKTTPQTNKIKHSERKEMEKEKYKSISKLWDNIEDPIEYLIRLSESMERE